MHKVIAKQVSQKIINEAIRQLDIDITMQTDPKLITIILKETKLHSFKSKFKEYNQFIQEIQTNAYDLKPFLNNIISAIIKRQPQIIELLQIAIKQHWLHHSKYLRKTIHHAFLLDYLTAACTNNNRLLEEMQEHMRKQLQSHNIDLDEPFQSFIKLLKASKNVFEPAKIITIDTMLVIADPEYQTHKTNKKLIKRDLKNKELNLLEYNLLSEKKKMKRLIDVGILNIYEAAITEDKNGFHKNALCGYTLAKILWDNTKTPSYKINNTLPKTSKSKSYTQIPLRQNNKSLYFPISKQWQSNYLAWNLAFIIGNVKNPDILLPKLLIPTVLDSKPEYFVKNRVVALWFTTNFYMHRILQKKHLRKINQYKQITKTFETINKKHVYKLAQNELNMSRKQIDQFYKKTSRFPYANLAIIMAKLL